MIYKRQRTLREFLDIFEGSVRSVDFQKRLFLYCQEEAEPSYAFVPYRFGCFSFTSYADTRKLIEKGLLSNVDDCWQLTPEGRAETGRLAEARRIAVKVRNRFPQRGDPLVAEVYRRYPWHATRSEIA